MSLLRPVGLEEDCIGLCSLDGGGGDEGDAEDGVEESMMATYGIDRALYRVFGGLVNVSIGTSCDV